MVTITPRSQIQIQNPDHDPHGKGGLTLDLNLECPRVNTTNLDPDLDPNSNLIGCLEHSMCVIYDNITITFFVKVAASKSKCFFELALLDAYLTEYVIINFYRKAFKATNSSFPCFGREHGLTSQQWWQKVLFFI